MHPNSNLFDEFRRTTGYSVEPAGAAGKGAGTTSLFPKAMSPDELRDPIKTAAANGKIVNTDDWYKRIVYDVPDSYKYDIDKVEVRVRTKSGLITTAWPKGGSDVTKFANTAKGST